MRRCDAGLFAENDGVKSGACTPRRRGRGGEAKEGGGVTSVLQESVGNSTSCT